MRIAARTDCMAGKYARGLMQTARECDTMRNASEGRMDSTSNPVNAPRHWPGVMKRGLLLLLVPVIWGIAFPEQLCMAKEPGLNSSTEPTRNPPNWGQRKEVTFKQLKDHFANPDMIYAPFLFWFWDEPLAPAKMGEMSRVMGSQGFNSGYAHGRDNMVGLKDLPDEEWLGDKWFNAFGEALGEAEKQKRYLGYCDEYWWPSFQAHGRVLKQHPELKAESLNWQIIDAAGGTEVQVPASYFAVAARLESPGVPGTNDTATIHSKTLQLIGAGEAFTWKAPQEGPWRVYAFNKYFKKGLDGGAVNAIDDRLAKAFIDIALEPYAKRLGDKLGKSIPGVFRDHEGDYGRQLAWSDALDRRFKERHGRDIRLSLPLMVNRDVEGLYAKARWEWFDLVSDLYAENFQAITDWHERHGMYTTAHFWEESLPLQVHGVGDHLKVLRALTMPGQDCLGKKAIHVHDFKEVESVAEFQGSRATTELMGAGAFGEAGNGAGKDQPWGNFNPVFLKQAVNAVTAWGMSHIIPHGVFTCRKLTGNPWPPDWYAENPMFPYMHCWTDFARRAGYINSMGSAVPDVLLFNPMESAWINAHAAILDVGVWDILEGRLDDSRYHLINRIYAGAINSLTDARVEFLVGDRYYLKQMEVRNGKLVRGGFSFSTIVLPLVDILTLDTARKIVDFAKAGGRVYALGELPGASAENGANDPAMKALMDVLKTLPSFTACPDGFSRLLSGKTAPGLESPVRFLSGEFPMLQQRRRIDGRDFFWLVNNSDKRQDSEVVVRGVKGGAAIWDCETGESRPVSSVDVGEGSSLKLSFKPLEAYWLVFDPQASAATVPPEPARKEVASLAGNWRVTFDKAIQPDMEYPSELPAEFKAGVEKPLEDWKGWGGPKFSGLVDYTKTIEMDGVRKGMCLDLGKVCHAAEVWVNGKPVGARLWGPYVYDVSSALRPGKNEIRIRVANLINNSYGDIEESGLFGPVRLTAEE